MPSPTPPTTTEIQKSKKTVSFMLNSLPESKPDVSRPLPLKNNESTQKPNGHKWCTHSSNRFPDLKVKDLDALGARWDQN